MTPPLRIMLIAALLPGFGHVALGQPQRGLIFQVFMLVLGWITWHATGPDRDFAGRIAGGLFIYAISVIDAYRIARVNEATRRLSRR